MSLAGPHKVIPLFGEQCSLLLLHKTLLKHFHLIPIYALTNTHIYKYIMGVFLDIWFSKRNVTHIIWCYGQLFNYKDKHWTLCKCKTKFLRKIFYKMDAHSFNSSIVFFDTLLCSRNSSKSVYYEMVNQTQYQSSKSCHKD